MGHNQEAMFKQRLRYFGYWQSVCGCVGFSPFHIVVPFGSLLPSRFAYSPLFSTVLASVELRRQFDSKHVANLRECWMKSMERVGGQVRVEEMASDQGNENLQPNRKNAKLAKRIQQEERKRIGWHRQEK